MTRQQKGSLLIAGLGVSLLPMWRLSAGTSLRGINLWQYINEMLLARAGGEAYPHVTVEQAIENARLAYCTVKGLDYEQSYSYHYPTGVPAYISLRS